MLPFDKYIENKVQEATHYTEWKQSEDFK